MNVILPTFFIPSLFAAHDTGGESLYILTRVGSSPRCELLPLYGEHLVRLCTAGWPHIDPSLIKAGRL